MIKAIMPPQSSAVMIKPLLRTVSDWSSTLSRTGSLSGVMPAAPRNWPRMIMMRLAITGRKLKLTASECSGGASLYACRTISKPMNIKIGARTARGIRLTISEIRPTSEDKSMVQ
jgi:hypothetical protein